MDELLASVGVIGAGRQPLNANRKRIIIQSQLVMLDELKLVPQFCHRDTISMKRLAALRQLRDRGCVLPSIVVWQNQGDLYLLDGWHRYVLAKEKGVQHWPAIVVNDSLENALIFAIRQNISNPSKARKGPDATRAGLVLSCAMGKALQYSELKELGLGCEPECSSEMVERLVRGLRLPDNFSLLIANRKSKPSRSASSRVKPQRRSS